MPFSMCLFSLMTDCSELSILSFMREMSSRSEAVRRGCFVKGLLAGTPPCLECGFIGRLFSFAGSALLLAAVSVMVVVSLFLVLTLYGGLRWPLTISPFESNRESSSPMEFNCSSSTVKHLLQVFL